MAYDVVTGKRYTIDFDELETMVRKSPLNFHYKNEWISGWLEVLNKAEQDTDTQINNISFEGCEVFQKELHFPTFTFYFNFVIPGTEHFIEELNPKTHTILLKDIRDKSFALDWTPTDDWRRSVNNQKPIICTRFPYGVNEYLLIDGNHRLTAKMHTKQEAIKSYIISPREIVDHKILPMAIDRVMYLFIIESANFTKALSEKKYTDREIFDSSLVHSAFANFFK